MRRTVLSLAFLLASAQVFAGTWTDLWLTPDQQGQSLLNAGDAGEAAQRFQDPRLRAYADVKAGNYNSAAEQLAPLKDPDSLYNRGNALARAGKLKEALAAYDAALAKAPDDRDARHNRDLVERQLQKQNEAHQDGQQRKGRPDGSGQQGSGGQQGQQGQQQNGSQQGGGQQQSGGERGNDQGSQQQSAGQQGRQNAQGSGQSQHGDHNQSSEASRASEQNGRPGSNANQDSESHSASNGSLRAGQSGQNGGANNSGERDLAVAGEQTDQQRAAAARRDAEAAFQRDDVPQGRVAGSQENRKPTSEQALAREQWLRRIPEDPGELLRRKFMVEHMKKQQDSGQ